MPLAFPLVTLVTFKKLNPAADELEPIGWKKKPWSVTTMYVKEVLELMDFVCSRAVTLFALITRFRVLDVVDVLYAYIIWLPKGTMKL